MVSFVGVCKSVEVSWHLPYRDGVYTRATVSLSFEQVLPTGYRRMVIEFSNDSNWYRFISSDEDFIGVNTFGKSGSEKDVLSFFELDIQDLVIKIKNNL